MPKDALESEMSGQAEGRLDREDSAAASSQGSASDDEV